MGAIPQYACPPPDPFPSVVECPECGEDAGCRYHPEKGKTWRVAHRCGSCDHLFSVDYNKVA